MNNEEYTFAKASDFTKAEKFDIALEYMKWIAKLLYCKLMMDDNLPRDEKVKRISTISSLITMYQCLSNDDHFIRCATELQIARESPIWAIDLPEMFK